MTSTKRWHASKARKRVRYRATLSCCVTRVAPGTASRAATSLTRTGSSSSSSSGQGPKRHDHALGHGHCDEHRLCPYSSCYPLCGTIPPFLLLNLPEACMTESAVGPVEHT